MSRKVAKEFVLIEHPAIIRNTERGVATLGGAESLNASLNGTKNLELRYRPENLYQAGIAGEKVSIEDGTNGHLKLIFRIRRKKSDKAFVKSECIGIVKSQYSFKSLSDFHYLPLQRAKCEKESYEELIPRLIPTDMQSSFSWWTHAEVDNANVPTFLPPCLFSRYTSGGPTKILMQESERSMESAAHGQNLRSERKAFTITVHCNDTFPTAPTAAAIADVDSRVKNADTQRAIKELFDERPMWSRIAIISRTSIDEITLKVLMAKYAFYILNGPWGRLWCKFGHDPRLNMESRKYQTIMVSFRKHQKIPERQRLRASLADPDQPTGIEYEYREGFLPSVRQMWYSVCDIHLPVAQNLIRSDYYGIKKECDPVSGWFTKDKILAMRAAIKEDVRRTSRQMEDTDEETEMSLSDESDGALDEDDDAFW